MKCWHTLNLDISNAIKPDFNFGKFLTTGENKGVPGDLWYLNQERLTTMFTEEWLQYMESHNAKIWGAMIFYRSPFYVHPEVHIDQVSNKNSTPSAALNWVIADNDDSDMVWYEFPASNGKRLSTTASTPYVTWPGKDVEHLEISRHCIGNKLTLVRTDIPHNIIVREIPRWSISVRTEQRYSTWDQIESAFAPYFLD